jgi:hypothetical protein
MSSVRRDQRNIVKKRQMLSCASGLRNLGASARKKRAPSQTGIHHDVIEDLHEDRKCGRERGV